MSKSAWQKNSEEMTKIDPAEDHLILASKVELINYETDQ
jgi:hypothetical protein